MATGLPLPHQIRTQRLYRRRPIVIAVQRRRPPVHPSSGAPLNNLNPVCSPPTTVSWMSRRPK
ncbi:hypothetical protein Hanom_Chr04g00338701 [Helianthus anomalus]